MKTDNLFVEILLTCISIEKAAVTLYRRFSEQAKDEDLKRFWEEMSDEERIHVGHWTSLLKLAGEGLVPHVFESLQRIKEQVDDLHSRIEGLVAKSSPSIDTTEAFTIACHLEFYMLNREFAYLLHFMRNLLEKTPSGDPYGEHLNKFFEGLEKFSESPELKLLGETIYRVFLENKELTLQSHTDPLTGLFNKRGLLQAINPLAHLAQRKRYPTGIMMVDIDSFKEINDKRGHLSGDEVLKQVAELIKANTRRSDIIARYGGDEFLVFLSEVDDHHLLDIGDKIRHNIEQETRSTLTVTVSIGIAHAVLGRDVEKDIETLIEKADYCLYQAKQYRNRVVIMHEQRAPLSQ
jgi:diguanylate cyclase (GGDEF)-like protein